MKMDFTNHYQSPLGLITLASDGQALTGLWFEGQKHFGSTLQDAHAEQGLPVFRQAVRWLNTYFNGKDPGFTPPLALRGTQFQKEVWDILLSIPYGDSMSYGQIAAAIAGRRGIKSMSAQAIGGAVAHNPVSIIVPCHRVVGTDGSLTGYAGGIERKIRLLALERVSLS